MSLQPPFAWFADPMPLLWMHISHIDRFRSVGRCQCSEPKWRDLGTTYLTKRLSTSRSNRSMCDMRLVIFLAKSYKTDIALESVDVRYAACDFSGQELQNRYRTPRSNRIGRRAICIL